MRLKARFAYYVPGIGAVEPGAEFDVSDEVALALMAKQANHFERVVTEAVDAPPADKMVRRGPGRPIKVK